MACGCGSGWRPPPLAARRSEGELGAGWPGDVVAAPERRGGAVVAARPRSGPWRVDSFTLTFSCELGVLVRPKQGVLLPGAHALCITRFAEEIGRMGRPISLKRVSRVMVLLRNFSFVRSPHI
jgi:hypothetical protein